MIEPLIPFDLERKMNAAMDIRKTTINSAIRNPRINYSF
jgi:hypothetical protein